MITQEELEYIRTKLLESKRPLIFFDDDPDGVSSFVLFYRLNTEAKGICVKGKPLLEQKYVRKVEEHSPDQIFVLDKPLIEQEFLDEISQEVIWLDHHPLQENKRVKYFNPRKTNEEDNSPTSYWAYQVVKNDLKNALWIAMIGIVGDWSPLLFEEFRKEYPDLLPSHIKTAPEALFTTRLGTLIKIIDFNLKGTTTQVMQAIKILTRIESPYEILDQTTSKGKYLYKNYATLNEKYELLKKQVKKSKDQFLVFKYTDNKLAISSMLSNELLFENPDKIIIIAREKQDELMLSLRSSTHKIKEKLEQALHGVNGYGGGHDYACGACIKKQDFDIFIEQFKELFGEKK